MNRPLMTIYDIQAVDPATPRRLLDLAFKHKLIAPAVQMGDHHYYTAPLEIDRLMAFAAEVATPGVAVGGPSDDERAQARADGLRAHGLTEADVGVKACPLCGAVGEGQHFSTCSSYRPGNVAPAEPASPDAAIEAAWQAWYDAQPIKPFPYHTAHKCYKAGAYGVPASGGERP